MSETPTGATGGGGGGGGVDPGPGDAKKGMSTGAKVLFGCLAVTVLGIAGLVVALAVGGFALQRGVESAVGSMEQQQQASEMLEEVEAEHPFEPPEDAVVGEERLERFLGATETAWQEIQPWAEDLEEIRQAVRSESAMGAIRDLASGARALGGIARSRVALAEALAEHEMSLGEYVWTGIQLDRAVDAVEGDRSAESVPEANLELARSRQGELPRFDASGEEEIGSGVVLAVATLWGMADASTWQALGLDTLTAR